MQRIGLESEIRKRTVEDQGIRFVYANDKSIGEFPASDDPGSLVREIEIMRGDIAAVFYEASKDSVEYVLGDSISALNEHSAGVTVSFDKAKERDFDFVVAADGQYSKTRQIAFGYSNDEVVKSLKQVVGFYSIP